MKPKYVYHGSGKKLIGDELIPKKANDLDKKRIHNSLNGIYASSYKDEAISMGLMSCKGVGPTSLHIQGINGKIIIDSFIYKGWPKQKYFYLYTLPSTTFDIKPKGSYQWISLKPVKPQKIEKLLVKKYIHLVRKATKKEKKDFESKLQKNKEEVK